MAFLLGLGGGSGSRRRVAAKGGRLRPKRHASGAAARFGDDLQSYSRNFDDGLVSGHHHRFQAPVVALAS
uniref:Uncharacterized protein n=1 Tax=Oryza brachyantha TaxID=4533 RepID=J3N399_ORYBR